MKRFRDLTNQQWTSLCVIPILLIAINVEMGCGKMSPQTAAAIFNAAATSVGRVLQIAVPNWTGLATYNKLVADATPLIAAGITGTSGQKALIILTDIASLLQDIPGLPSQYSLIIGIGIAGFESVIALIQAANPPPAGKVKAIKPPTYTSVGAYQKAWNAEIAKHPELAPAKLKL